MAGINIEKYHGATEAKAVLRHCDTEQRLQNNHSNEQIDKSKTGQNKAWSVKGCDNTYAGVCSCYDSRLQEVDSKALKSPRKDRVTLVGMELPRPEQLPAEKFNAWSASAVKAINEYYMGKQSRSGFLSAYTHVDEVHDYKRFDESTQTYYNTSSREHLHIFLMPYSADGSSLNAKQFTSRQNLIELNKVIDNMTFEKYGVRFCNGTGRKSKKSVEELKQISEMAKIAEADHLEAFRLKLENDNLRGQVAALKAEVKELRENAVNEPLNASEGTSYMDKKRNMLSGELQSTEKPVSAHEKYPDMPRAPKEATKYNNTSEREIPSVNYDDDTVSNEVSKLFGM